MMTKSRIALSKINHSFSRHDKRRPLLNNPTTGGSKLSQEEHPGEPEAASADEQSIAECSPVNAVSALFLHFLSPA
ncbi:MAG: hypothetical protein M3Q86_05980 [Verrucomicrobiota bacterium]|nr:hypothetical protein [Verrucomicrobiota bacterium]